MRIGALLIDNIVILALGIGILLQLGIAQEVAITITSLIYMVYTILVPTLCQGYQLGKYLLGMKIVTDTYDNPGFSKMVVRELSKVIYAIPIAGVIFIIVSQYLMNTREDGKTIHDLIAHTRVIRI